MCDPAAEIVPRYKNVESNCMGIEIQSQRSTGDLVPIEICSLHLGFISVRGIIWVRYTLEIPNIFFLWVFAMSHLKHMYQVHWTNEFNILMIFCFKCIVQDCSRSRECNARANVFSKGKSCYPLGPQWDNPYTLGLCDWFDWTSIGLHMPWNFIAHAGMQLLVKGIHWTTSTIKNMGRVYLMGCGDNFPITIAQYDWLPYGYEIIYLLNIILTN